MKLKTFFRSPSFVAPALSMLLVFSWFQYVGNASAIEYDKVTNEQNILVNADFDDWSGNQLDNWSVVGFGSNSYSIEKVPGRIEGQGLKLSIPEYTNGGVTVYSPELDIKDSTEYYFKSFYETDGVIDLAVTYKTNDGSQNRQHLKHYPDYDYPWSSMSSAFESIPGAQTARIEITMTKQGFLEMDESYLIEIGQLIESSKKVDLLESANWEFFKHGELQASGQQQDGIYSTSISNRGSGQAGWIPNPIAVSPAEYYSFDFAYQSLQSSEVGVDLTYSDGTVQYEVIELLQPTPSMTNVSAKYEVPKNVVAIQPSVQLSSDGNLRIGSLQLHKLADAQQFDSPRVSITFDDGWQSSYDNGARILEEFGFEGTFYINPGFLNQPSYMTDEQVVDLLARNHRIGSHTNTHIDLTSFQKDKIIQELDSSNKYIQSVGVNEIDFASPFGKHDEISRQLIDERQSSHRGTDLGVNTKQNLDLSNLKGLFIRKELTNNDLRDYLNEARETNGWLILIYHNIEPSESFFAVDRDVFRQQMEIVGDSGIDVVRLDQVVAELQ